MAHLVIAIASSERHATPAGVMVFWEVQSHGPSLQWPHDHWALITPLTPQGDAGSQISVKKLSRSPCCLCPLPKNSNALSC